MIATVPLFLGAAFAVLLDRAVRPAVYRALGLPPRSGRTLHGIAFDLALGVVVIALKGPHDRPFHVGFWTALVLSSLWDWWHDDDHPDRRDRARERAYALLRRFTPSPIPAPAL